MIDSDRPSSPAENRWRFIEAGAEVTLIFLLFFLWAGSPTPDVNEAHYLAKAKHYWNPTWCQGDPFLESADAHMMFYWSFGWLTLWLPLPAVAWLGRVITWILLAWSWRRLSYAVVPRPLAALLSASVFLVLSQYCHMAGEWMVGGVEAKGFAFVFILLAGEALVKNRWRAVWLLLGAATAFHVLLGGWSMVAAGVAWLVYGKVRPSLSALAPAVAAALMLASLGIIPAVALSWGVDSATVQQANEIYVFERLSHHLVLLYLPKLFVWRHVALLGAWLILCWLNRRGESAWRLNTLALGAVVIAVAGALIDILTVTNNQIAANLLRYYWFRLSDFMLPLGVAIGLGYLIETMNHSRPVAARWLLLVIMSLATGIMGTTIYQRQQDPRPGADIQSLPEFENARSKTEAVYEDWRHVCQWIAVNTEPDSRVLTPRMQQTFKWRAGRTEVVTWKDVPQDARGIVQWRDRFQEVYLPYQTSSGLSRQGLAPHDDTELIALAKKYQAGYILIDRTDGAAPRGLTRIYPNRLALNRSYVLYRVPSLETSAATDHTPRGK